MAVNTFDKLNMPEELSYKPRAIPYEDYFGEMELEPEEKKDRISLAEDFEVLLLYFFLLYLEDKEKNYEGMISERYEAIANKFLGANKTSAYIKEYARKYAQELQETTRKHDGDIWYTSSDRARFNAENESEATSEYRMKLRAVKEGKKNKRWLAIIDAATRTDHIHANGQTVGIFETFKVGDSEFDFPKSLTYDPSPEQVVNCRCRAIYF